MASTRTLTPTNPVRSVRKTLGIQDSAQWNVPVWRDSTEHLLIPHPLHVLVGLFVGGWSSTLSFTLFYFYNRTNCFMGIFILSGPPGPPEDLTSNPLLSVGSVQLMWRSPANTGGRKDVTYNVFCERCNGALCVPCGGRVRFEPTQTALSKPEVTVSAMEPHINYTFTVEALNGVSEFINKKSVASITTVLHFTGTNYCLR